MVYYYVVSLEISKQRVPSRYNRWKGSL